MLINADVKGLELVAAADLSKDPVLSAEIWNKFDTHADNQAKFKLPDRVTAKRFVFKLLYGGSDYGFANDSDFLDVGYSVKQWATVIEAFYTKYEGIKKWHDGLLETAMSTGNIEIPSGRYFNYRPNQWGKWPLTTIKNYPVQGWGADLVMLARIEFNRRLRESGLDAKFICTVHDSLVVDTTEALCYNISMMLKESIEAVPALCKTSFGYEFSLPLTCEIQAGPNKRDMHEITL